MARPVGSGVIPVADRFWSKVNKTEGCWLWIAALNGAGYGTFWPQWRTPVPAHRWAYEAIVGPIPEGLYIDHLCRVRNCVNPEHLEPVTPRENVMRGETVAAANAAKTHCDHGHAFDELNTFYTKEGWRRCRRCDLTRQTAWREANRAAWNEYHRNLRARKKANA